MVCIEKRPHKMRGRSLAPNFIYLTCLLDRGHINSGLYFFGLHYSNENILKMEVNL